MTTLADGSEVVVCGSHELSHQRAARVGRTAWTVAELVSLTVERRDLGDRRTAPKDELAGMLTEAFAPKRGRGGDRRKAI